MSDRPSRRVIMLLGMVALITYLPGFWWGSPHATAGNRVHGWGVDDETPIGTLAQVYGVVKAREYENLGYPMMHSLMVSAAMSPYLATLWVQGDLRPPQARFPFGLSNPAGSVKRLSDIAHLLSVFLGVGTVLAVLMAAATLWGPAAAVVAGVLAWLSYPMFYYSRTGNVDVPVLFFTAVALAAYARVLVHGFSTRRGIVLGLGVGFALATKEPSLASFIGIPFVLVGLELFDRRRAQDRQRAEHGGRGLPWVAWLASLATALLAFAFGSGLLLDPQWYMEHLAFARSRVSGISSGAVWFMQPAANDLGGNLALAGQLLRYLADCMTIPGLALAILGIGWAFKRDWRRALYVVPAATYLVILFAQVRYGQLRYVMPASVVLVAFAGYAVIELVSVGSRLGRSGRLAGTLALAAVILLGVLRGADITYEMVKDSRYAAGEWMAANAVEGSRVEFFGPDQKLPPLPAGVASSRAAEYRGAIRAPGADSAATIQIVRRWRLQPPDFVLIIPDHSSLPGSPRSASCPEEVYQRLVDGSLGYREVASFETPRLFPWLPRPALDYPTVNPPIRIFAVETRLGTEPADRVAPRGDVS